jgi:hypothetical protein
MAVTPTTKPLYCIQRCTTPILEAESPTKLQHPYPNPHNAVSNKITIIDIVHFTYTKSNAYLPLGGEYGGGAG